MQKRKAGRALPLGLGLKRPLASAKKQTDQFEAEVATAAAATAPAAAATAQADISQKASLQPRSDLDNQHQHQQHQTKTASTKPKLTRPSVFQAADGDAEDSIEDDSQREAGLLAAKEASVKKKRNLDLFLEELKQGQEQREKSKQNRRNHSSDRRRSSAADSREGGVDEDAQMPPEADDGVTTNLYIGNVHPEIDEQELCLAFAKYGPIGSVKIMWPRTPEEHARNRNSGFVSFMDRECAAKAIRDMDRCLVRGRALRVCWGKRVPIPPRPIFALDSEGAAKVPRTGYPFNAMLPMQARSGFGRKLIAPGENDEGLIPEVHVQRPLDHRLVRTIHWTIEHVIAHGAAFECALISKHRGDQRFKFLVDCESQEHVYYRWKMYSLLNGDTKMKWRDKMFFMYDEGPIWIPPKVAANSSQGSKDMSCDPAASSSEAEEVEEKGQDVLPRDKLGARARDRLERRIKRLHRPERGVIADAMAFAIDHAYAAGDVVDTICRSLLDQEASAVDKLCVLMLISDILHNCSVPVANAWRLRQLLEERLDEIFEHLLVVYKGIDARLRAEHFRKQVLGVLAVWEAWTMFPQATTSRLAEGFLV